jgi:hypothetical protein
MIIENARERVYLGVHWVFDAFAVKKPVADPREPDFNRNIGGSSWG